VLRNKIADVLVQPKACKEISAYTFVVHRAATVHFRVEACLEAK
jgi:hypothetical protein